MQAAAKGNAVDPRLWILRRLPGDPGRFSARDCPWECSAPRHQHLPGKLVAEDRLHSVFAVRRTQRRHLAAVRSRLPWCERHVPLTTAGRRMRVSPVQSHSAGSAAEVLHDARRGRNVPERDFADLDRRSMAAVSGVRLPGSPTLRVRCLRMESETPGMPKPPTHRNTVPLHVVGACESTMEAGATKTQQACNIQ